MFDVVVYGKMKAFLDRKYMNRYNVYEHTRSLYGESHALTARAAKLLHAIRGRDLQTLEIYKVHGDDTGSVLLDIWVSQLKESCHA